MIGNRPTNDVAAFEMLLEEANTSPDFGTVIRHRGLMLPISRIGAIGNAAILNTPLLGFFCSARCPGNVIIQIYDLARALRDAGISVIGGFQSPMEKECLDLLLRGQQPVVICPAHSLEQIQLLPAWRRALAESRLLLSPFAARYRRPTTDLADQRNRVVAALAQAVMVAHASPGQKLSRLPAEMVAMGQRVYTLDLPDNAHLISHGVIGRAVPDLIPCLQTRKWPAE